MNKKIWSAALLAAVMLLGAGCGQKPGAAPGNAPEQNVPDQNAPDQNSGTDTPSPGNDSDVKQPDQGSAQPGGTNGSGGGSGQTTDTPDGNAQDDQKSETITVYYTDPDLMELKKGTSEIKFKNDKEKYTAAFKALQSSGNDQLVPLWEKAELKSVEFGDGKLTIDMHLPDEARFGSSGEAFAVDALKQTFFQFKEVQSLQLLVDGKQVESLMGHVTLENPETR